MLPPAPTDRQPLASSMLTPMPVRRNPTMLIPQLVLWVHPHSHLLMLSWPLPVPPELPALPFSSFFRRLQLCMGLEIFLD